MSQTLAEAVVHGFGDERPCLCPVHDDTNASASVNVVKKVWVCYSCGASGKLTGDALLIEADYARAAQRFQEKFDAVQTKYAEGWLSRYDAGEVHPYWVKRFGVEVTREFRLGFDPDDNAVTFPIRDPAGVVLGVVRRSLDPESGWRYKYPLGVDISRLLGGYTPQARRALILVEGFSDVVAMHTSGYEAMCIYGARLSKHQIRLIRRLDPTYIICAFDQDDAGNKVAQQVERAFPERMVARAVWPVSWGKDVDAIGHEHRREIFTKFLKCGVECVECDVCGSPRTKTTVSDSSSTSTSTPRGMRIRRMSA